MSEDDERSYEMIHLLDSPFYSRKTRYLTVIGEERTFDLLVSNRFYPIFIPLRNTLASLTVTSDNLVNKIEDFKGGENQIVTGNLHSTSEEKNFVTYGKILKHNVSDDIFDVYLACMNFNIASRQPIVLSKIIENKTVNQIVGQSRYFRWINYYQFEKEYIDTTFNIILVNFSEDNFHFAREEALNFKGQTIPVIAVWGNMLVVGSNDKFELAAIRLSFDKKLYREILRNDFRSCVLQVYTLYNLKREDKEQFPINLVLRVLPFDMSYEQLIPFMCPSFKEDGLSLKCSVNRNLLEKVRTMIMEGTMESLKEIHSESKLYKSNYGANEIEFSIFNPKVALSLIETYVDCESSRDILDEIFRSPSLISSATDLWKGLSSSVYWNKSLVNGEARRRILGSFKQ